MESIRIKLIVNVVLIHAILMSLIVFDLVDRERNFMQEQLSQKGYIVASILATSVPIPLLNNDLIALNELLADSNNIKDSYMIFILDKNKKVKASTSKGYFNKYLDDTASITLMQNLIDSKKTNFQILHDNLIDTINVVKLNDTIIGYTRTLIDRSALLNELTVITGKGLIYVLLAILLGGFFAWWSVRTITSRLDSITKASVAIANKDFEATFPESNSNDEISKMIKAFKVMSQSMHEYLDQLKKSNEIIYNEKELAEVTLSCIGDCVVVTDGQGCVKFINPAAEKIIKYTNKEAAGKKVEELFKIFNEASKEELCSPIYTSINEQRVVWLHNHTLLVNRYGKNYYIEDSSAPILNMKGVIEGAILVFHDVSEKKKQEKLVNWQAKHDNLTKLNNRFAFETILENLTKQVERDNSTHILLFMDLDKFKIINDSVGHLAGDQVLREIAALFSKNIRNNDFLGRFGGDEFGLILFDCGIDEAKEIAQKLIDAVLEYTYYKNDKVFKIGLSVGIAKIDTLHKDPTTILSSADFACYLAKDKGRNRYYIAQKSDKKHLGDDFEFNWIFRINQALKENKFVLHAQKIKDLTGEHDHYEILLRMLDTDGKILYPDAFLPQAERYSLMPKIDLYVIKTFFSWFDANKKILPKNLCFSVNVTGQSISDTEFVNHILTLAQKYDIDCARIIFEITETTAISNIFASREFFDILNKKGFRFSLDDFGTGLSSFAYLKNLPIDFLKIDGVFIKDILDDAIDRGMVESIHKIGSLMGLKIVAEYAESDAIISELKKIGIHYAQGYAIEKPHSIDDLIKEKNE